MAQTEPKPGETMLAGRWVLVAEDQYFVADAIGETIASLGGRVLGPVGNVAAALRRIAEQPPDLAVLDVDLDGEKVYPVAEKLLAAGVPFAFTTGFDQAGVSQRFKDAPHLTKPIRYPALFSLLRDLCDATGKGPEPGR